jgi:putative ABC transport system ATP-binding protein
MGLVFQEFELIEYLNVLDNILLPFRIHHALKLTTDIRRRASGLARSLGIDDKLHRWPGQLSQGERQRVAIGRALITNPQWLLADEPTGNLDPAGKRRVLDLMLDQAAQRALTVVLVTHDHGLLDRFDRVVDVGRIGAVRGAESAAVVGDSIQSGAAES